MCFSTLVHKGSSIGMAWFSWLRSVGLVRRLFDVTPIRLIAAPQGQDLLPIDRVGGQGPRRRLVRPCQRSGAVEALVSGDLDRE